MRVGVGAGVKFGSLVGLGSGVRLGLRVGVQLGVSVGTGVRVGTLVRVGRIVALGIGSPSRVSYAIATAVFPSATVVFIALLLAIRVPAFWVFTTSGRKVAVREGVGVHTGPP